MAIQVKGETYGVSLQRLHLQHSPSSVVESKFSCKVFDLWQGKGFGESVGNHVGSGTIDESQFPLFYYPMDEVKMHVDVLSSCMLLVVLS